MPLKAKRLQQDSYINSRVDASGVSQDWEATQSARKSWRGEKTNSQAWTTFMPKQGQRIGNLPHTGEWSILDQAEMVEHSLRKAQSLRPLIVEYKDPDTGLPIRGPMRGEDGRLKYPTRNGAFVKIAKEPVEEMIRESTERREYLRELTKSVINMEESDFNHIVGYNSSMYHKPNFWPPGLGNFLPKAVIDKLGPADATLLGLRIESRETEGRAGFQKLMCILEFTFPDLVSTQINVNNFAREDEAAKKVTEQGDLFNATSNPFAKP